MEQILYSTPRGLLLRILDRTQDPQQRAERLLLATRRRFLIRRVQDRRPRQVDRGGRR